ncbi:hypothetical protein IQ289_25465 [Burkholderia sp. R-70006]|uniref:hypothetical protein n=1 Tax=Paraburkholderia domus TaxID=2793075 RepID=UPI001913450C|nr:hypothetical protein [Paraburkholderia domus]MBK5051733.1 hypothetical protein [Burkholderia sp. R-70006]
MTYLSEAACIEARPRMDAAVISITEPGRKAPLNEGWGAVYRIQFSDAEWDDGMVERLQARGMRFDPESKGFPGPSSTAELLVAIHDIELRGAVSHVVVHCHAGRRRSAAVARFIAQRHGLPFDMSYDGYNRTVFRLLNNPPQRATVAEDRAAGSWLTRWWNAIQGTDTHRA